MALYRLAFLHLPPEENRDLKQDPGTPASILERRCSHPSPRRVEVKQVMAHAIRFQTGIGLSQLLRFVFPRLLPSCALVPIVRQIGDSFHVRGPQLELLDWLVSHGQEAGGRVCPDYSR